MPLFVHVVLLKLHIFGECDCIYAVRFAEKILHEHLLCFPNLGEINIQALKVYCFVWHFKAVDYITYCLYYLLTKFCQLWQVKRRGNFYRLPDSMFVKSAFDGIRKGWFLSVDASRLQKLVENQDSGDIVACFGITDNFGLLSDGPPRKLLYDGDSTLPQVQSDWHAKENTGDNNYNILSLDTNNRSDPKLQEKHELLDSSKCKDPIMHTGCDEDNFRNVISDDKCRVSLDGGGTSSAAGKGKQKHKSKKRRGNESLEHALKENDASAQGTDKDILQQDIVVPDNSLVSEDGVLTHDKVTESKTIADKPCHISSETSKNPGGEVQMTNLLSNGTAVSRNYVECEKENLMNAVLNVQCRVSMKEASPGPTKKKQKSLNNKNSSEMMLSAPVQEVRENETVPRSLGKFLVYFEV
jgi:hypothetical protein